MHSLLANKRHCLVGSVSANTEPLAISFISPSKNRKCKWQYKVNLKTNKSCQMLWLDLSAVSGSRDVIGHVTIRFPVGHFLSIGGPLESIASISVSKIFNGECDAMVGMTLNDL